MIPTIDNVRERTSHPNGFYNRRPIMPGIEKVLTEEGSFKLLGLYDDWQDSSMAIKEDLSDLSSTRLESWIIHVCSNTGHTYVLDATWMGVEEFTFCDECKEKIPAGLIALYRITNYE